MSVRGLVAAAALLWASTALADTKIAVVDVQRALMQTEAGMNAAATMQNYAKKRQAELDGWQEALTKEQSDLRRQIRVLSARAYQRRLEHFQERMLVVQKKFVDYNKELATKQQELTAPLLQKLVGTIRRAASRKGFDLVIDKQVVPWANAELDLTDLVVQMYNSGAAGADDDKKEGAP